MVNLQQHKLQLLLFLHLLRPSRSLKIGLLKRNPAIGLHSLLKEQTLGEAQASGESLLSGRSDIRKFDLYLSVE